MKEIFNGALNFVYGIAHLVGNGVAKIIQFIFPEVELPLNVIDAVGFLCVLTAFLILVQAAKKIAWIIVIIGWVLLIIRIVMLVLHI